jgi:hypothetical protein
MPAGLTVTQLLYDLLLVNRYGGQRDRRPLQG